MNLLFNRARTRAAWLTGLAMAITLTGTLTPTEASVPRSAPTSVGEREVPSGPASESDSDRPVPGPPSTDPQNRVRTAGERPGGHRPVVKRVKPASGPMSGGTQVQIRGHHFTRASHVWFGPRQAAVLKKTRGKLFVASPPSATPRTVNVRVETRYGKSKRGKQAKFTYSDGATSVVVSPNEDVTLNATPELTIEVPAGAGGDSRASLTYTPAPQFEGAVADGFTFEAYGDVHLSSGQPTKPLTFTWRFDAPLPLGASARFYTGSPDDGTLRELETTIAADRMSATAEVRSLSFKGLAIFDIGKISRLAGQLFSTRGDRPECVGSPPAWVTETIFIDKDASSADNPLLACVGRDPGNADRFVVKLTNNRGHGLMLRVPTGWTWMYMTGVAGLEENIAAAASRFAADISGGYFLALAPGQQVHFGFSRKDVGSINPLTIQGLVDPLAVAYGLIFGVTEQVLGEAGGAVLSTVLLTKCMGNLVWKAWGHDIREIIDVLWDHLSCLASPEAVRPIVDQVMGTPFNSISDALKDSGKVAKMAKEFGRVMLVFGAVQQVGEVIAGINSLPETFAVTAFLNTHLGLIGSISATPEDPRPTTSTTVDLLVRDANGDPMPDVLIGSSAGTVGRTGQDGHLSVTQATRTTVTYWANTTSSPAYEPQLGDVSTTVSLSPPEQCFVDGDGGTFNVEVGELFSLVRVETNGPWDFPHLAAYQGLLDWGDGATTATAWGGGPYGHRYSTPGTYKIRRTGSGVLSSSLERCLDNGFYTIHVRAVTKQVTVYNKVTNGATSMREDTPAYLSTVTRNFCKRDGCAIAGTDMNTGHVITAYCTTTGARTTNGQDNSSIDDNNPGLYTSTRWYGIQWNASTRGYLSEVWVESRFRGGLGLPAC